jgi:hypothetical protein
VRDRWVRRGDASRRVRRWDVAKTTDQQKTAAPAGMLRGELLGGYGSVDKGYSPDSGSPDGRGVERHRPFQPETYVFPGVNSMFFLLQRLVEIVLVRILFSASCHRKMQAVQAKQGYRASARSSVGFTPRKRRNSNPSPARANKMIAPPYRFATVMRSIRRAMYPATIVGRLLAR